MDIVFSIQRLWVTEIPYPKDPTSPTRTLEMLNSVDDLSPGRRGVATSVAPRCDRRGAVVLKGEAQGRCLGSFDG